MAYKHGAYGEITKSKAVAAAQADTVQHDRQHAVSRRAPGIPRGFNAPTKKGASQ